MNYHTKEQIRQCYLDGRPINQIAEAFNTTEEKVKKTIKASKPEQNEQNFKLRARKFKCKLWQSKDGDIKMSIKMDEYDREQFMLESGKLADGIIKSINIIE